ncbi:MAG TPA: glycosyltransferase family 2 protein [Candidatus Angelobacter sp.]|nr:glycosyltransferase family 2 protein [Candidatus Angelobacter sp.]
MLSVVVPIFDEQENIVAFHAALEQVLEEIPERSEVVYVNDGSRDSSLELLLDIQRHDSHVVVVELSRNFGHQPALSAGMATAQGDAVVLMDGDFQDPPEVLPLLFEAWRGGAKVVIANRRSRTDGGIRGKLFPVFYKVMRWLSDYPIPVNAGIFGLLDREAVDALNQLQEHNRYLPGMRAWIGFPSTFVSYDRHDRAAGRPKQTFSRLFKYAMDAIFSFSYKPLRLGMAIGSVILGFSILLAILAVGATLVGLKFFGMVPGEGFLVILVAVFFLGGIQLVSIGILGEYVGRIYDEVRHRPLFLIRELHRSENSGKAVQEERKMTRTGSAA